MAAEIIQFIPRSRSRVKVLLPIVCRVPNAIEQVFVDALGDTSPCEMNHAPAALDADADIPQPA